VSNDMNLILIIVSIDINILKQRRLNKKNQFWSSIQTYIQAYHMINPCLEILAKVSFPVSSSHLKVIICFEE
jgi:hypothetical protein